LKELRDKSKHCEHLQSSLSEIFSSLLENGNLTLRPTFVTLMPLTQGTKPWPGTTLGPPRVERANAKTFGLKVKVKLQLAEASFCQGN